MQNLKPLNCVQIKLFALDSNTWKHLTEDKWALARLKIVSFKLFPLK